jgi:hypothetical protein
MLCLAGAASADDRRSEPPLLAKPALFALDLTWTMSLLAMPSAASLPPAEPQPIVSFANRRSRLFSLDTAAPGLQLSLDPDSEELLVGWQFEF